MTVIMRKVGQDAQGEPTYQADNGYTMRREHGLTPNGNPLNGRWVLRDADGKFIDFDQYRHDLIEHNNFRTDY